MPEYLSPGVYVEEVPSGPRPIEGVSTSTAGIVGFTERGPTRARMVTSWGDYQSWFGGVIDPAISFAPFAIRGFFDNGGQRIFVARVTRDDAVAASQTLATAGGVLLEGSGALKVALGARMPKIGVGGQKARTHEPEKDLWRALDRGYDPTDDKTTGVPDSN